MCEASGGSFVSNNICKCDKECPTGVICVEGKCASECKSNDKKCETDEVNPANPAKLYHCIYGTWNNNPIDCGTSECQLDKKDCKEKPKCSDKDTTECFNDTHYRVCQNGTWTDPLKCPDGYCDPQAQKCKFTSSGCIEDARKCANNTSYFYCQDGSWDHLGACPENEVCEKDTCVPAPTPNNCTDGQTQCDGNILKTCENGAWIKKETCPNGCENKACKPEKQCDDEVKQCNNEKTEVQICKGGQWTQEQECTDGECSDEGGNPHCTNTCTHGNKRCTDDKKSWQECNSDNKWSDAESCPDDKPVCENGECKQCTDGQTQCDRNILKTCENGKWYNEACHEDEVCKNGECRPASVDDPCNKEDTSKCDPKSKYQLLKCSQSKWAVEEECKNGCDENSNKCKSSCKQGATKCADNELQTCTDGEWQKIDDCPLGCNSTLTACKKCQNNAKKCENDKAYICNDGSWGTGTHCSNGCENDQCKSTPISNCNDGDFQCVKDEQSHEYYYRVCDESLSWKNTICYSQETPGVVECTNTTINKCGCDTFCQDASDSYNHLKCQNDKFCISDKDIKITKLINDYKLDNAIINKILPCGNFSYVQLQPCLTSDRCTKGDKKCEGNSLLTCNDKKTWKEATKETCKHGCDSNAKKCFDECNPELNNPSNDNKQCKDSTERGFCNADGTWDISSESAADKCRDNRPCVDDKCSDKCSQGDYFCEDISALNSSVGAYRLCSSDNKWNEKHSGLYCIDKEGKLATCTTHNYKNKYSCDTFCDDESSDDESSKDYKIISSNNNEICLKNKDLTKNIIDSSSVMKCKDLYEYLGVNHLPLCE